MVINVYGGLVQEVFASDPDIDVVLVDWDVAGSDRDHPDVVSILDRRGSARPVYVAPIPVLSPKRLADSEVGLALTAAQTSAGLV